jgi:uncharacterized protein involved in outer membrane biogenesis
MTKTRERKLWSRRLLLLTIAGILVLLLGGGAFFVRKALRLENYRSQILQAVQGSLHRRVIYESGDFSFRFTPSFTFNKIVIMEKDGSAPFLTADRLTFRLSLLPLLERRLVLSRMVLDRPSIAVNRDPAGVLSIADLLEEKGGETPLQVRGVRVKEGSVRFVDRRVRPEGFVTALRDIEMNVTHRLWGKGSGLKLEASVAQEGKPGTVTLDGTVQKAGKGKPFTDTWFSGSIETADLDGGHFWDYYRGYVPMQRIDGRLNLDTKFKGKLSDFTSKGKARITGLRFEYFPIFHAILAPKDLNFSYEMELNPKDILVTSLQLNVDALRVKGSCALKDIPSGDLFIDAHAVIAPFRLEDFHTYIPYGVIPDDTSRYIEQHIKGGTYRLEEGSLVGRISQIAHMEKGTNYNVLHIKGTAEKGLLTYGSHVPTFNNIRGNLEMRGKDFILSGMKANFGGSPFTLDGRITDYPMNSPCGYPFTMTMAPRAPEIVWLLGQEAGKKLSFSGDSTLSLQGSGPTSGYSLNGTWDLSTAAYAFRDLIAKPAGQSNRLSFQSVINDKGTKVPVFNYDLAHLALSGAAEYRSGEKTPLSFSVKSNEFPIQEVAQRFPRISRYQPSGGVRLAIRGAGGGKEKEYLSLGGEISLKGASFKPSETMKALSSVNGTVAFQGDTLKTTMLTAHIGNSPVTAVGTLTGFTSPVFSLVFSSPSLDLADLGLHSPGKQVRAQRVHGSVSLRDNTLTIKSLAGQINRSSVRVSGTVTNLRTPKAELTLNASYLDMDDVALLTSLDRDQAGKAEPSQLSLMARVTADAGNFHDVDFRKLRTNVHFAQRILYLEDTECSLLGGSFAGKGRIDFGSVGGPRYQASIHLKKIEAERLLHVLGTNRELTGALSLEGELTAKGDTLAEVKASSLGNLRLHCEDGSLRKFPLLSKLFSILNVSQLFKFQLPDMVSGGMPYDDITASFSFRDGVVRTDDLYIDSEAMNISILGQFDLVKDQLDVTIGVKPLQTVDKVVSRIPIAGWILTGKKKSLITTYFEAKGSLDNPTVKSIAAKSMAKGVFNIFKRLFSLPAKLITDTGEVIINQ